jgi:hypothetical protein
MIQDLTGLLVVLLIFALFGLLGWVADQHKSD